MLNKHTNLFLINARLIPIFNQLDFYMNYYKSIRFEFIMNEKLELLECTKLLLANQQNNSTCIEKEIKNFKEIYNVLFELNHVKINPQLDNCNILKKLYIKLLNLGIEIEKQEKSENTGMCFQPLGTIKDNLRFYIKKNNQITFLSKHIKLKLI